jgi:hypothetical protein
MRLEFRAVHAQLTQLMIEGYGEIDTCNLLRVLENAAIKKVKLTYWQGSNSTRLIQHGHDTPVRERRFIHHVVCRTDNKQNKLNPTIYRHIQPKIAQAPRQ